MATIHRIALRLRFSAFLLLGAASLSWGGRAWADADTFAPGYDLIRDEGTDENRRGAINFIGAGVSVADDSATNETEVTIDPSGGGFDPWTGDNAETMDNAVDDMIEFQGVGGADNTDFRLDLDGTGPTVDSPTDTTLTVDDALTVNSTATVGTGGAGDSAILLYDNNVLSLVVGWDDSAGNFAMAPATLGTGNFFTLSTTTGLTLLHDLVVTGGDITLGTTSIFSGGDTASLNNVDAINATTETTLEAALDIGGEVTSTGMASTVIADSVTVTGWVMGASTATTPAADDNDTSLATTAYVQTELNAAGGRSLTASAGSLDADAELYTDTKTLWFETPTASDDFKSIWTSINQAVTITAISCESDQTVVFDLQIDDGTPTGVNGSDITCTTFATDSSLAGDTTMANGDRLDLALTSVSGTPTWVSISWTFTRDD